MDDDLFKEDRDDIIKIGKVSKDFYQLNQATYQFTVSYNTNLSCYSTIFGIDVLLFPSGTYTGVVEIYFDKAKINKNQVTVDALSSFLQIIERKVTKVFDDHSRSIITFYRPVSSGGGIDDLGIDLSMKQKKTSQ